MKNFIFAASFFILTSTINAKIVSFFPEGPVKELKQVIVRFDSEMTNMGDPLANTEIYELTCLNNLKQNIPMSGLRARWADSKSFVIDFDKPLASGMNCEFHLHDGVLDINNKRVSNYKEYFFSTGGIRVLKTIPEGNSYSSIDSEQYFLVAFDGEVDEASLIAKAYFEIEGIAGKEKIKIIKGKNRDKIISFLLDRWDFKSYRHEIEALKKDKEKINKYFAENFKNFVIVGSERKFPDGARVVLHFDKGLLTKTKIPNNIEDSFEFKVMPPLEVTFSCGRANESEACNPIESMQLNFSNGILLEKLIGTKIVSNNGQEIIPVELKKDSKKAENVKAEVSTLSFKGPFKNKEKFKVVLAKNISDIIDRKLVNANKFPLSIATSDYTPLIKFPSRFGIVEWDASPMIPLSVRNVEKKIVFKQDGIPGKMLNLNSLKDIQKIIKLYEGVNGLDEWPRSEDDPRNKPFLAKNEGQYFFVPKPSGEAEFEMIGMPMPGPGFYFVEVESPMLGAALTTSQKKMYVQTTALVTNMAIHFKKGEESSLVFVTSLNTSTPVAGANVSIRNCKGNELSKGVTSSNGTFKIAGKLVTGNSDCYAYYVFAQKDKDFTFINSSWEKGIESYRYGVNRKYSYNQSTFKDGIFHTLLDRALFKVGETVSMQHYMREFHQSGFKYLSKENWPKFAYIEHSGSGAIYTIPLKINPKTFDAISTFKIPKEAALGKYTIYLSKKDLGNKKNQEVDEEGSYGSSLGFDHETVATASFTVADYKLPMMQANVKILGDKQIREKTFDVDLSAHYLSGGPAKNLKVNIRKQIQFSPEKPDFVGADDFIFYSEKLTAGVKKSSSNESEDEEKTSAMADAELSSEEYQLGEDGGKKINVKLNNEYDIPKRLYAEMEYADPNGEIKVTNNFKTIYPSKYVVGVAIDSWIASPDSTKLNGVIVDLENKPVKNYKFVVHAFKQEYYSHRKRLVGGFYSYDSTTELKDQGVVCEGNTDDDGRFHCEIKNLPVGYIYLQATVSDQDGHSSFASTTVDIFESGVDRWAETSDSDRIDILPEKKEGTVNEKLKLMVKTPFKEATALVTVEREGVLDHYVTTIKRDNPIFELPIKSNYAPNIFVSVMLIRGRVTDKRTDFLVDLNRPALKMGLIPLKIGWKEHLIKVNVATDKKKYHPREFADIKVILQRPDGSFLPKGSKVTIVAFDDALSLLKKNETFDLLKTMMNERPLAVSSSSGQTQVIGKRHFGSKAKSPGGDGGFGDGNTRELFDTLLAFLPNLEVNEKGEVNTRIKLNDSMTNFKVYAVATSGESFFGYGFNEFVSTKDIILYSGAAPLVHEGDKIKNKYTIRNTTKDEMNIKFDYSVVEIDSAKNTTEFKLGPSEAKTLFFETTIPKNFKNINLLVSAVDTKTNASDVLKTKVKVEKSFNSKTTMATVFQLEKPETMSVQQPKDTVDGEGGLNITMNKSLLSSLVNIKNYMEEYPYSCLEQQTSKAIVSQDKKIIQNVLNNIPNYFDQDGLLKYFVTENTCGSVFLNNYLLNIFKANNITIPKATSEKMYQGLMNWFNGNLTCHVWWMDYLSNRDHYFDQEKIMVFRTLSDAKKFNPKFLESVKIDIDNWALETKLNFRKLLINEESIPNRNALLLKTENSLKASMTFNGSNLVLQSNRDSVYSQTFNSSTDEEAILFFNEFMNDPFYKSDIGRLANGLTRRMNRGIFDTTMANAWAVTAFKNFSEKFESIKLTGTTKVTHGDETKTIDWDKNEKKNSLELPWKKDAKVNATKVEFEMNGTGRPWVTLQTKAAYVLKGPLDLGYKIQKEIKFVTQKTKGKYSVGDVLDIHLKIKSRSDQFWVAVSDPIAAGSAHLNNDLDGESKVLEGQGNSRVGFDGHFPEEFAEKKFSGYISYAAYLPAGDYELNYKIRLNSAGVFKLPNTRVEAMYNSDIYGELNNDDIEVVE